MYSCPLNNVDVGGTESVVDTQSHVVRQHYLAVLRRVCLFLASSQCSGHFVEDAVMRMEPVTFAVCCVCTALNWTSAGPVTCCLCVSFPFDSVTVVQSLRLIGTS